MNRHFFSFMTSNDMIRQLIFSQILDYSLILVNISFGIEFEHIDIVQIIEILSVEPSENNHATAYKTSAVSSSRLRMVCY